MGGEAYYAASGRRQSRLIPSLVAGSYAVNQTGGALTPANTAADDVVICVDSTHTTTLPGLLGGSWASLLTETTDPGTNDRISMRVSWKKISAGEQVPAIASSSRRQVAAWRNCDPTAPIEASAIVDSANALSQPLVIPALTLLRPVRVVVGARKRGTEQTAFPAAVTQVGVSAAGNNEQRLGEVTDPASFFGGFSMAMTAAAWAGWSIALLGRRV